MIDEFQDFSRCINILRMDVTVHRKTRICHIDAGNVRNLRMVKENLVDVPGNRFIRVGEETCQYLWQFADHSTDVPRSWIFMCRNRLVEYGIAFSFSLARRFTRHFIVYFIGIDGRYSGASSWPTEAERILFLYQLAPSLPVTGHRFTGLGGRMLPAGCCLKL